MATSWVEAVVRGVRQPVSHRGLPADKPLGVHAVDGTSQAEGGGVGEVGSGRRRWGAEPWIRQTEKTSRPAYSIREAVIASYATDWLRWSGPAGVVFRPHRAHLRS